MQHLYQLKAWLSKQDIIFFLYKKAIFETTAATSINCCRLSYLSAMLVVTFVTTAKITLEYSQGVLDAAVEGENEQKTKGTGFTPCPEQSLKRTY